MPSVQPQPDGEGNRNLGLSQHTVAAAILVNLLDDHDRASITAGADTSLFKAKVRAAYTMAKYMTSQQWERD